MTRRFLPAPRRRCAAIALGAALLAAAPLARAQGNAGAGAQDAAEQRSQSFQAVQGAVREDVPGGPLLLAAYAAIWVILLLYVIRLVRLQQRAQADVERLERVLARDSSSATPALRGGATGSG